MSTPLTRGACPALSAPMQTGDGLLVRLSPERGSFTPVELAGLAEASVRHGNSILEVTARGSLQIRGLETDTIAPLAADIDALGIAVRTGVPVETGPLAGLDTWETANPRSLAEAIRSALEATDLPQRLGPKVSVVVDGGGRLHLDGIIADLRLTAAGSGSGVAWKLAVGGSAETALPIASLREGEAGKAAVSVLAAIAELGRPGRARELDPAVVRTLVNDAILPPPLTPPLKGDGDGGAALPWETVDVLPPGGTATESPSPVRGGVRGGGKIRPEEGGVEERGHGSRQIAQPIGIFDLAGGRAALGVGLPFGQIEASRLAGFCRVAGETGVAEIRLAPGRAILLLAEAAGCLSLQAVAPRHGFIVDPADARLSIAACPGSPACASGHIAARAIAEQLAALGRGLFNHSFAVHVSGCAKGCARPAPADLTFVGHAEGVDLVVGGTASGIADMRLDHAEIRHGFARLAGLYREKRRSGESASACFSRLGASRVAAAFRGPS
jgi:precorrin-3B synthase